MEEGNESRTLKNSNGFVKTVASTFTLILEIHILLVLVIWSVLEGIFRYIIPIEEKSVKGEIVLITGAGHGLGRELALLYAAEGATVICWDVNEQNNEETLRIIEKAGCSKGYAYKCDVTDFNKVAELCAKIEKDIGDVTILINNAGIMPSNPLLKQTRTEIQRTIDINTMSHFWTIQCILPTMLKNNYGHIVAVSSLCAIEGMVNLVAYSCSKYAVRGLMRSLQKELEENKTCQVKTTTVYPYVIDTGLVKSISIRFPFLTPMLKKEDVAKSIMSAQRRNVIEAQELSLIGGDSVQDMTKTLMYRIFTNQLGVSYTWEGLKNKNCLKITKLAQVMITAIRLNVKIANAAEMDIIKVIKAWLLRAKERLDNSKKTDNKPQTAGAQARAIIQVIGEFITLVVSILWISVVAAYRLVFPVTKKSVKNEVVLITGAGHGIGRELALQYASEGATVVCWDINSSGLKETLTEIEQLGYVQAHSYICNVAKREEVMKIAELVQQEVGDVTILINNAGIMPTHPFLEHTPQEIENIININVMAHFWTLQAFLPYMMEHNRGHIVALSSIAGLVGQRNLVPYSASKFAVRGMMECLHLELRSKPNNKIRFTTIFPYMVNTGLCKKPVIRFPSLMPLLNPKEVAQFIIDAQRRNVIETTIPTYLLSLGYYTRLFPFNAAKLLLDFLNAYLNSDLN
ncbi:hypothetical protein FQR65_LT09195 [Abscondita terminalis]|nr:hypothetical protein FQR65_LT09195 [Abscondita terminalis]